MIYRFLAWFKFQLAKLGLTNKKVMCQICAQLEDYSKTSVIKVRHSQGAIFDMVICQKCGDILEKTKKLK